MFNGVLIKKIKNIRFILLTGSTVCLSVLLSIVTRSLHSESIKQFLDIELNCLLKIVSRVYSSNKLCRSAEDVCLCVEDLDKVAIEVCRSENKTIFRNSANSMNIWIR